MALRGIDHARLDQLVLGEGKGFEGLAVLGLNKTIRVIEGGQKICRTHVCRSKADHVVYDGSSGLKAPLVSTRRGGGRSDRSGV